MDTENRPLQGRLQLASAKFTLWAKRPMAAAIGPRRAKLRAIVPTRETCRGIDRIHAPGMKAPWGLDAPIEEPDGQKRHRRDRLIRIR
jgi:hypothetical protein